MYVNVFTVTQIGSYTFVVDIHAYALS